MGPQAVEGYGGKCGALRPRQYGVRKYRNDVFITGLIYFFSIVQHFVWYLKSNGTSPLLSQVRLIDMLFPIRHSVAHLYFNFLSEKVAMCP